MELQARVQVGEKGRIVIPRIGCRIRIQLRLFHWLGCARRCHRLSFSSFCAASSFS